MLAGFLGGFGCSLQTSIALAIALTEVQRTSASALQWLSQHGGRVDNPKADLVSGLAALGAGGECPQNCERDMHRFLERVGITLRAKITTEAVRMWNPSKLEVETLRFPMILPEELCNGLWNCGTHVFRKCLFGDLSEREVESYWGHVEEHCPWFQNHPCRGWPHRGKLASVVTYGDEVQAYKNSECGILSVCAWSSELSYKNDPLLRYFLFALWSEHHECEATYDDMIRMMVRSLKRLGDPTIQWPWTRHGYLIVCTGVSGDLKWINDRMKMHNFKANAFCSRCHCVKVHPNRLLTLPHFAEDPEAHAPRDYSGVDLGEKFSPLMSLPGMDITRVQHDVMHSQLLGSGKVVNGTLAQGFGNACWPGVERCFVCFQPKARR